MWSFYWVAPTRRMVGRRVNVWVSGFGVQGGKGFQVKKVEGIWGVR